MEDEEDAFRRRLEAGGLDPAEEARIHHRLAHLEEDKMRQHELDELESRLHNEHLSHEEEIAAREKVHQLEGFARSRSRRQMIEKIENGELTEEHAELEMLHLDDADAMAKDRAKVVARIKSGTLSEDDLAASKQQLAASDHHKKLKTKQVGSSVGDSLDDMEAGIHRLVSKAEAMRSNMMDVSVS